MILVAVMVDLGWPWWVSSLIAAGVALLAALAFWRIRRPFWRGVAATLIVQGIAGAVAAPLLMDEMDDSGGGGPAMSMSSGMDSGMGGGMGRGSVGAVETGSATTTTSLPFSFFLTHYEPLGHPANPTGVRYHSTGRPFATAPDGSRITLTGGGSWDPATRRGAGGGRYEIASSGGAVRARGSWTVKSFVSFNQVAGWWGIPGFKEEGRQGPRGSASFSGFLKLRVGLERRGPGLLTLWCLMPGADMPPGHFADGMTLTGPRLDFTGFEEVEDEASEGVMFYGPGRAG